MLGRVNRLGWKSPERLEGGGLLAMNGPDYVWPSGVYRPREPLVYLDLNHWIGLAKAYVGHPAGRGFVGVLNAGLHAAQRGSVKFPLSATHYLETQRIKDPAQRRSIAEVMEELSSFRTLLHVGVMREMEIQAALDSQLGPQSEPLRLPLIGVGVAWAFGQTLRLTIQDVDGNDCATDARQEFPGGPEAFDDRVRGLQLQFERDVLMGPQDPDESSAPGMPRVSCHHVEQR